MAAQPGDALAVAGWDGVALTFDALSKQLRRTSDSLLSWGIGRGDRIACVLSDGVAAAAALLGVANVAACVPLHASCSASEFETYLRASRATAVLTDETESAVREVARRLGIQVWEIGPGPHRLGGADRLTMHSRNTDAPSANSISSCALGSMSPTRHTAVTTAAAEATPASSEARPGRHPQPNDVAIIFYTSGTTGRPKGVPLTHAMLCLRAYRHVAAPRLTPEDRCLSLMPLCHYGGFSVLLRTLASGSSIAWLPTPGPDGFFAAVAAFRPSWYTATPTLHSAIASRAAQYADLIARYPLRFIQSGSAKLDPGVWTELERVFRAPVVTTYGTTETSRIARSALPPERRKVGSVGLAESEYVAVLDEQGHPVPAGTQGEIGVRGPAVFAGYEDDPDATRAAFRNGWFRTGDGGQIDEDGFLFITDRIKDVINRGGMKVSPHVVEAALLAHPHVAAAAAFGVPHPTWGEDVAAAAVVRPAGSATGRDLRAFAAGRLAPFETPSRILVVDSLPTSPAGKVQKRALAEQLAAEHVASVAPATDVERAIAAVWKRHLQIPEVGLHDNFFALSGDSLTAARVVSDVHDAFRTATPVSALLRASTVAQMAGVIRQGDAPRPSPSVVSLHPNGDRPPLFCIHGGSGNVLDFHALAALLGPDQPVYGLQAEGLDEESAPHARVEDMAAHYIDEVETLVPRGPYFLCGRSFGGIVALEMAQQWRARGQHVAFLGVLDTFFSTRSGADSWRHRLTYHWDRLRAYGWRSAVRSVSQLVHAAQRTPGRPAAVAEPARTGITPGFYQHAVAASARYALRPYPGRITLHVASHAPWWQQHMVRWGWAQVAEGPLDVIAVPGTHETMLDRPIMLAAAVRASMDAAGADTGTRSSFVAPWQYPGRQTQPSRPRLALARQRFAGDGLHYESREEQVGT